MLNELYGVHNNQAIFYGYPETGSDDDGLDLSVDDFFLSGSSSDEAEPKCKVWHNPGALLENIIYPRAYTYEHQYNMLLDLASKMNEEPFRLLIVDYVITLLCVRLVLTSLEEDNLQSARALGAPECMDGWDLSPSIQEKKGVEFEVGFRYLKKAGGLFLPMLESGAGLYKEKDKERVDYCSEDQYAVSIKEDTAQSQPLKILGKGEGLPTWPLYSWEGNSRVDEMILARVSSGFAGKKYGRTSKLYLGLLGGKDCFLGKLAEWSPKRSGKSHQHLLPNMAKDRCLSLNPHLDLASSKSSHMLITEMLIKFFSLNFPWSPAVFKSKFLYVLRPSRPCVQSMADGGFSGRPAYMELHPMGFCKRWGKAIKASSSFILTKSGRARFLYLSDSQEFSSTRLETSDLSNSFVSGGKCSGKSTG
ncbi:meiotic recombination protein DMC1 [Tanacetum coccineum]